MNRYEAIVVDVMVDIREGNYHGSIEDAKGELWMLTELIRRFRAPICELPVEDGCGAMVDKGAK